jgi:hypothetical protein
VVKSVSDRNTLLSRWDGQSCQTFTKVLENDRLDERSSNPVSLSSQNGSVKSYFEKTGLSKRLIAIFFYHLIPKLFSKKTSDFDFSDMEEF